MDNTYIQCVHYLQRIYYAFIYGEIKEFQKCQECMHSIHWKQEIHVSWLGFYFSYLQGYINICSMCWAKIYIVFFAVEWSHMFESHCFDTRVYWATKGLGASWKHQYKTSSLSVLHTHSDSPRPLRAHSPTGSQVLTLFSVLQAGNNLYLKELLFLVTTIQSWTTLGLGLPALSRNPHRTCDSPTP